MLWKTWGSPGEDRARIRLESASMRGAGPEIAVVGAGVVGLACAAERARAGRSVVVLERHDRPGTETSSRNSQVIHAGLYYLPGSLKAVACIEGRELLYERCARLGIAHRRLGKLVVATTGDEVATLGAIREGAVASGAGELEWLDEHQVKRLEPRVKAVAALLSRRSGIVDAHALMDSYQAELESLGGRVVVRTRVVALTWTGEHWRVDTIGADGERYVLEVPCVVNVAGLEADRMAALAGLDVDALGWRVKLCKGDYFSPVPSLGALTSRLVYPVPSGGGLGAHVTLDLGGRFRFGPDAEYVDRVHYEVDPAKSERFAAAVQRYLPDVRAEHLVPEMSGIRPKLQGPGEPFRDFVVAESSAMGAPAMVHLVGIESPGLTASGALARRVAKLLPRP
jgi:L-2-hydroxyglutarate oxidase LhgO